jgi:hypothetical protein
MSATPALEDGYVDGNALAGALAEIFAVDVTSVVGCCGGCRASGPIARLRVYGPAPGLVARCPECDQVMLRLVQAETDAWLDLRGTLSLRIPRLQT